MDEGFPLFNWGALPEQEHEAARHVQTQLVALSLHEAWFRNAVDLVDHSTAAGITDWAAMGAEGAILGIYNFQSTINSIRNSVGLCPALKRKVDTKRIQRILDEFDSIFPDWLSLRDGVCHYSDKLYAPPQTAMQMLGSGSFIHGYIRDRTIRYVVDGREVSFSVTEKELAKLTSLKLAVYEAFRKVSLLPPGD